MSFSCRNQPASRRRRNDWLCLLPAVAIIAWTVPCRDAVGAAWEIKPRVRLGANYQSNPARVSDTRDSRSATGLRIDARLPMTWQDGRWHLSLDPRLDYILYPKDIDKELKEENQYVTAQIAYSGMRSTTGVAGGYSNVSTRTAEFETPDPDSPSSEVSIGLNLRPEFR